MRVANDGSTTTSPQQYHNPFRDTKLGSATQLSRTQFQFSINPGTACQQLQLNNDNHVVLSVSDDDDLDDDCDRYFRPIVKNAKTNPQNRHGREKENLRKCVCACEDCKPNPFIEGLFQSLTHILPAFCTCYDHGYLDNVKEQTYMHSEVVNV